MHTEKRLLEAAIQGDTAAFEELVQRYQSLICAITFSGTASLDASEELAQETFFRAWRNRSQLKDIEKFRGWLCSIARNLIRNYHRKNKAHPETSIDQDHLIDTYSNPSDQAVKREEVMILEQALKCIPIEYREPLVLFYRQEQSIRQVADYLDLNEGTVRTRLHRGRQMLKEQTAAIVEQSLAKTSPDAAFTKAVMAGIGAGIAAGVAGGAAATATTVGLTGSSSAAGGSILSMVAGVLTTAGGKIVLAAAAVMIAAGVAVYSYQNPPGEHKTDQSTESALSGALQGDSKNAETGEASIIEESDIHQQAVLMNDLQADDGEQETQSEEIVEVEEIVLTSSRHPDWPTVDEKVENYYCQINEGGHYQKMWVRMPCQFRSETQNEILIDNGKERIEVMRDEKTVQYSETQNAGNKPMGRQGQALTDMEFVRFAYLFGRPADSFVMLRYQVSQIAQEDNGLLLVYQITGDHLQTYDIKAYVDAVTRLPEKIVVINHDPNTVPSNYTQEMLFDYAPIDDSIFEYTPGGDETVLPYKQKPCFRGQVVDVMGDPVSGADVFIHYFPLYGKDYITGRSDDNGKFQINIPEKPGGGSVFLPVYYWATIADDPNYAAWTILHREDDFSFRDVNDLIQGYGGTVIQTDSKQETVSKTVNGVTTTYQQMNTIQNNPVIADIRLVMEPTAVLRGYVTDTAGHAIENARLSATFSTVNQKGGHLPFNSAQARWKFDTVSDARGYYEFRRLLPFWKGCEYTIDISASGFVSESKRIKLEQPLDDMEFNVALNPQLVTIKGVLKDNYGQLLAGRSVSLSVPKINVRGCSTKTDPNGVFVLEGCPDVQGLTIWSTLSNDYPEGSMQAGKEVRDAFLYYPDISQQVPYTAGKRAYFVELTAVRPEMKVEVFLTDSAGKPLSELKVKLAGEQLRSGDLVSYPWQQMKLEQRSDSNGSIVFDNVPDLNEMRVVISPPEPLTWELHGLNDNQKERMRLEKIDRAYSQKYQPMEVPVEIVEGQTDYSVHIVVLTKEEFEALPAETQ